MLETPLDAYAFQVSRSPSLQMQRFASAFEAAYSSLQGILHQDSRPASQVAGEVLAHLANTAQGGVFGRSFADRRAAKEAALELLKQLLGDCLQPAWDEPWLSQVAAKLLKEMLCEPHTQEQVGPHWGYDKPLEWLFGFRLLPAGSGDPWPTRPQRPPFGRDREDARRLPVRSTRSGPSPWRNAPRYIPIKKRNNKPTKEDDEEDLV